MARKKKPEEHENHERWLVSYADFITLLFAFFVVMYSVSSVNEGKYRVLSNSLTTAFGKKSTSISPISLVSTPSKASLIAPMVKSSGFKSLDLSLPTPGAQGEGDGAESEAEMEAIADEIAKSMKGLIDDDSIKIGIGKNGVEVEINTSILFESGSSGLQRKAVPTLRKIAKILKKKSHSIHVEGFTDNVPIFTEIYPSNWELSAARAASVVHLFAKNGVDPGKMAAIGYGEYQPAESNATESGRKKNRRVVVVISPEKQGRKYEDILDKFKGGSDSGLNKAEKSS